MKKSSGSSQNLASFLSPGEPNYKEKGLGSPKGWLSERVLQPALASRSRRHGFTPFNSGRTMPSKWDEAERWICSRVSSGYGDANNKISSYAQLQRRPKSKSGPILPPGTGCYSNYSPTVPLRQGLVVKNLMVGSPFSTGVLAPGVSVQHHNAVFGPRYDFDNGFQYSSPVLNQNDVALPSVSSAPLRSELMRDPSFPNSQDEKSDGGNNENTVTSLFSKRDKGTQMSPPKTENENDADSSPKSSPVSIMDKRNCHSNKLEVKDVQIDSQATDNGWSKRHPSKLYSLQSKDLRENSTEAQASCWDIAESTFDISKVQREEAKIIAWESLQKAKAEAEIRKLEMKLEKKRSSSMDKILKKLRRAQMKAEKMRGLIPAQQGPQVSRTRKVFSFHKYAQLWSPSSCFSSQAL